MGKSIKTYLKTAAKDYSSRSVNPPVVRASTILFKTMQELRKHQKDIAKEKDVEHWDYGRQGTQTTVQLQKLLRGLEEAYQVFLTPTGFAAVALGIMSICRPGDEIVISDGVYRPTQKLTDNLLKEFNIKAVWYNPNNFEGWVMLGKSYIIISDFHSAALAYETAITLDNTDKTVLQDYISLLRRLDSKNNKDKILRAFDILIALDKSDINSFNMKLNYSIDINDSEMTKNILRKIIINKNIKDKKPYETMLNKLTNTDK